MTRIATNVNAMKALDALNRVNSDLSARQMRLATGQRFNSAKEDSAGWVIGKNLEARSKGLSQALNNVGDAQSLLGVAEGSLQSIQEILTTMKVKVTQAASDTMGSSERTAIKAQLDAFASEIDSIVSQTSFNGVKLLDGTFASKTFQIGSETTDTMTVNMTQNNSAASLAVSALTVDSAANASVSLGKVNSAISTINSGIGSVGSLAARLDFKSQALSSMISNTEAAKSQVLDADLAQEQLAAVKLQILQQTATAALAQANSAPQSVMQLFR
jgi:flagellin